MTRAWLSNIRVRAFGAASVLVRSPLQLLAVALLTEVARKWPNLQEAQQGEKFADSVLHGRARKTPFVRCFQGEASPGNTRCPLLWTSAACHGLGGHMLYLDAVRFVENESVVCDGMDDTSIE